MSVFLRNIMATYIHNCSRGDGSKEIFFPENVSCPWVEGVNVISNTKVNMGLVNTLYKDQQKFSHHTNDCKNVFLNNLLNMIDTFYL
jgi:hypothetical protein